jgi:hypothetical protein
MVKVVPAIGALSAWITGWADKVQANEQKSKDPIERIADNIDHEATINQRSGAPALDQYGGIIYRSTWHHQLFRSGSFGKAIDTPDRIIMAQTPSG